MPRHIQKKERRTHTQKNIHEQRSLDGPAFGVRKKYFKAGVITILNKGKYAHDD